MPEGTHSFQPPQTSQQSNRQRFKSRGKKFKRRSNTSYSGSVSSCHSGSGGVSCGQCGGRHMTSQCRGFQGNCYKCGKTGNLAKACPSARGQPSNLSQQESLRYVYCSSEHKSFDCRRFTPPFGVRLVVLSSSPLDLSIGTILEPWVGVLRECEVVAVFVCLHIFQPVFSYVLWSAGI
ncbi:hypothetical protein F511_12753 [Dorcoceras hygrometricum]|uniref:CCHC-type domain-containing protein n=1 Tax=Dorcoceras hygrometricum TaxID=472368 RepID=A0A2Z7CX06_9LAMI|nr:hypothetical protein F511_12753 [Dorcoceras hygrometricum]